MLQLGQALVVEQEAAGVARGGGRDAAEGVELLGLARHEVRRLREQVRALLLDLFQFSSSK